MNRMVPTLSATWEWAAQRFAPRVGLDPDTFEVVNPHTLKAVSQAAFDFCDSTNDSTSLSLDKALNKLREEIAVGIVDEGEAPPALTKRVNQIFDKAEKRKAREIAQTETSRAVHAAQEASAIASGVVTGWKWLASPDACEEICLAIAARCPTVRIGQAFAIIGHNPAYREVKFPPGHPHCGCTVTEVLDTDPQPEWHATLDQPHAATTEEVDRVLSGQMDEINDIQPRGTRRPDSTAVQRRLQPPGCHYSESPSPSRSVSPSRSQRSHASPSRSRNPLKSWRQPRRVQASRSLGSIRRTQATLPTRSSRPSRWCQSIG